jgi:hypothetical protein
LQAEQVAITLSEVNFEKMAVESLYQSEKEARQKLISTMGSTLSNQQIWPNPDFLINRRRSKRAAPIEYRASN